MKYKKKQATRILVKAVDACGKSKNMENGEFLCSCGTRSQSALCPVCFMELHDEMEEVFDEMESEDFLPGNKE